MGSRKSSIHWNKWGLLSVAAGAGLFLLVWGGANLILNTRAGKRLLSTKVANVVGSPLEFERVRVMPWGVVRLAGVRMDVSGEGEALPPFFESRELEVRVAPWSLLSREVQVKEVALVEPVFSVVRDEGGRLRLPPLFRDHSPSAAVGAGPVGERIDEVTQLGEAPLIIDEAAGAAGVGTASGVEGRVRGGGTISSEAVPLVSAGGEASGLATAPAVVERPPRRPLIVRHGARDYHFGDLVIRQGRFKVVSFDDKPLLEVRDVELTLSLEGTPPEGGEFKASRASLFDRIEVENLRSPVMTDGITLALSALECDLGGGTVAGRIETNLLASGLPFLVALRVQDVPMRVASDWFGGRLSFSGGRIESQVQLLGLLRAPATYRGGGVVRVAGARLERNQFLGNAAPVAGVDALQGFDLEDISLRFAVLQDQVLVEELNLVSPDLSMSARGYVGLDGTLNVAARAYVSERVYNGAVAWEDQFPEPVGFGFRAFEGSSRFYRDYLVQGTIMDATIDFLVNERRMKVGEIREVMLKLAEPEGEAGR